MTTNQVAYWNYRENKRHNQTSEREVERHNKETEGVSWATQREGARHNLATEAETARHNQVTEDVSWANFGESRRHNQVVERETHRSNVTRETETARSNRAQERLKAGSLMETTRHNLAGERLEGTKQVETKRHNLVTEETAEKTGKSQRWKNYSQAVAGGLKDLSIAGKNIADVIFEIIRKPTRPQGGKLIPFR